MIRTVTGTVYAIQEQSILLVVSGFGLEIMANTRAAAGLRVGQEATLHTYLNISDSGPALFGFVDPEELRIFKMLLSVSGVGPKTALMLLEIDTVSDIAAAIQEGRADIIARAPGVGRKTAERIIVDLKGKFSVEGAPHMVSRADADRDIMEALVNLGYRRSDAERALSEIDSGLTGLEPRLKAALKKLGR